MYGSASTTRIGRLRSRLLAVITLLAGLAWGNLASANSIYVSPGMPDIGIGGGITWDYGGSTSAGDYGVMTGTTTNPTMNYKDPAGNESTIYSANLGFTVGIDSTRAIDTVLTASNSVDGTNNLVVSGKFTLFGGTVTDLLTATVSTLSDPTGNLGLQLIANVTGGSLASDYGGIGSTFYILANGINSIGGWDGSSFNVSGGSADIATEFVPVPGSLALLLVGLAGLRQRTRRDRATTE